MEEQWRAELEWDLESAELAYGVIARYVEHAQISGLIIAMLAGAVGEERLKTLSQSEPWQGYMASKLELAAAREDVERLTRMIARARAAEGKGT